MALNMHSKVASAKDAYGNDIEMQLPTPTTTLLSKRNQQKVESPTWKGYRVEMEHLTAQQLQVIIKDQVNIYLKDEPDSKRFTIELTLKEEVKE